MTLDDIPAGLQLCRASRWNQVARDWQQFLRLEPAGATVAVREGRVIGSVATLRFDGRFGWIAMVLVDPAERGRGIGRALLLEGLSTLGDLVARLDATPAGEVLYRKLGFDEEYRLTRLERAPAAHGASSDRPRVRPIGASDWPMIRSMDLQAAGADRSAMLTWLAEGAPDYARVCESSGGMTGFVLGRHGHNFEHIGPVIASDADAARCLVDDCLARHPERRFILDAPDRHASWHAWLKECGFVAQRPFLRMYRGEHRYRGTVQHVFASIGPEFG